MRNCCGLFASLLMLRYGVVILFWRNRWGWRRETRQANGSRAGDVQHELQGRNEMRRRASSFDEILRPWSSVWAYQSTFSIVDQPIR
jgi:hypothetical protein